MLPTTTQLSLVLGLRKRMLPKTPARLAQSRRALGCSHVGVSQPELLGPPQTHMWRLMDPWLSVWKQGREESRCGMSPCVVNTGIETGNTTGPTKNSEYAVRSKLKSRSTSQQLPVKTANFLEFFHQAFGVLISTFSKGTWKQCLGTIATTLR